MDAGYVFSTLAEQNERYRQRVAPFIQDVWAFRDSLSEGPVLMTHQEMRDFIDRLCRFLTIDPTPENRVTVAKTVADL